MLESSQSLQLFFYLCGGEKSRSSPMTSPKFMPFLKIYGLTSIRCSDFPSVIIFCFERWRPILFPTPKGVSNLC